MSKLDMMTPARALPAEVFTDPELFKKVKSRILDRSWHYVCHQTRVPEIGDYHAFELLGEDLFVIRGRDGEIRCFYNVCQHRGHQLVTDTGRTKTLVCPYHAWTYSLDGALKGAPNARRVKGFDKSKICLTEVRVDEFLGFLFVNLDEGAKSMRETFPGVEEAVLEFVPDMLERVFADEHSTNENCNWLVAVENYNECYHCHHCHKSFSAGIVDPETYDIQPFGGGRVLRHSAEGAQGYGAWYDTSESPYRSFFLFPCFSLQIYPNGLVNTYYWRPLHVGDTEVHRGWFTFDGVVDDALQRVIDLDRETTFAEDLALVRSVQRGLNSRGYRRGPLVIVPGSGINSEHSIAALHRWVLEDLDD